MTQQSLEDSVITIFGGTGFIGRYVVRELAKTGALIRVVSRDPQGALYLRTYGYVGQIVLERGSFQEKDTVKRYLEDTDIAINLVGILFESGSQRFARIHAQGAEFLAKSAAELGVSQLIHMSALGVDKSTRSKYARTKLAGERAVLAAFPTATILRPSIVFGPEDDFFNRFASMAQLSPFMPLIGGGHTKFQPVYVADIARAIRTVLEQRTGQGTAYELGGPQQYSFRELLTYIMEQTRHKKPFMPIPFGLASIMGKMSEILPTPPLTYDQVQLLKQDNIVSPDATTFEALGITPTAVEVVVPDYLIRYREGGRFALTRS